MSARDYLDRGARRERSLLSLQELSNELNVRMDLYEIADVALLNILGHFGCSKAALWILPESSGQDAVLVRGQGLNPNIARAIGTLWTRWLTARPGGIVAPVLVSDLKDLRTIPGLELAESNGLALFVPVIARRRFLGLLALGKRVGGEDFGPLELETLQTSINLLGVALENTGLYNRMVESNRRLRKANEHLQELDRLKSEFLNNMNHELRTPLTIMVAYLDSLIAGEPKESRRFEHLRIVREETEKLSGMLLNVLDFSKLLDDELEIRAELGDARASLDTYYEERRPGITADLRELRFTTATEIPPSIFDRDRLVQIVDCLVDNAVKFTPHGSVIHIRVEPTRRDDREWVRIDVEDDGPGIPADSLPHIFESFRQGDGSQTREHRGMGMGLAFARRLAQKMNADLTVESEIGKGARFSIFLPTG
jgi:signal transduction histidine kinase